MPTSPDGDHTGTRIAHYRKLARLRQRDLADRIPHSYSLLTQVEAGHKPASPDLIAAVAQALRIDVTTLTGQPYTTELQQDRLDSLVRPIREALDLYDLGADPDLSPRPLPRLLAAADDLCQLVRATKLNSAARALPAVMAELTTEAHRSGASQAWAALGSTYRTAHDLTVKLGFYDLSAVALDRMGWAAERASDPLLGAVRQYMRALVYFREGECAIGQRLVASGHRFVDQAETSRSSMAVSGQLHLGASVLAARARDRDLADLHLAEAAALADRTGEASEIHFLSFGPTNVQAHTVSAHMEFRRWGHALDVATAVRVPATWATSRRAHLCVDRARSEFETGRTDAALASINEARELAPQQTRYHPGARETIKDLVHHARREHGNLLHLATWIGL
jgi:transcriptional regulator with XRE-family HTH domain